MTSIIIPVRNDALRLARCLDSIRRDDPRNVELIVADNGSSDDSPKVAERAGATVLDLPDLRVSALRNTAALRATGGLLGFVDADHELEPGWIAAATEALRDPSVAAAGALYLPPPGGTWVQEFYGLMRGRTIGRHDTKWLGSGNMVVRRTAFEQVGGFDESLEACEDVDLCQRLRTAGFRVLADEGLRSIHHGDPPTLSALFRAERWRGRDNIRVTFRNSMSVSDLPSVLIPVVDLLCIMALPLLVLALQLVGVAVLPVVGLTAAVPVVLAGIRAFRTVSRLKPAPLRGLLPAFAVAFIYDVARALALITRAPHHRR